MPRPRTGQVYIERHGDHWDIRIDLPDGSRSTRACLPPSVSSKEDAKNEAHRLKAIAWKAGGVLADAAPVEDREAIDAYLDRWIATRRDLKEAWSHLRLHILPVVGVGRPLVAITRADCEAVVAYLDARARAKAMAWKSATSIWGTFTKLLDAPWLTSIRQPATSWWRPPTGTSHVWMASIGSRTHYRATGSANTGRILADGS